MTSSAVPLSGFCENCGHFAGRHQELRCHFPAPEGEQPCVCPGLMWDGHMHVMDMHEGSQRVVAHSFDHLKGFDYPIMPLRTVAPQQDDSDNAEAGQ